MLVTLSRPLVTPAIHRGLTTATFTPEVTGKFIDVFAFVVGGGDANEWIIEGIDAGDTPLLLRTSAYLYAQIYPRPPSPIRTTILTAGTPLMLRARRIRGQGLRSLLVSVTMTPYEWLFYCNRCGASGLLSMGGHCFNCAHCGSKLELFCDLNRWT
jgi:hypothetical protein